MIASPGSGSWSVTGPGKFTASFDARSWPYAGIEVVKDPAQQSRANAYAERFDSPPPGREVTDRMLIFGERHLRTIPGPVRGPLATDGDPIAAASSARPGRTSPSPTFPRSGSSAGRSSAASSTNTSEPHTSQGQDRWPSSGTPTGLALEGRAPRLLAPALRPASTRMTSTNHPRGTKGANSPARSEPVRTRAPRASPCDRPRNANRQQAGNRTPAQSVTGPQER